MTDKMTTQGVPSWLELMTTDASAAKEFYSQLLGWKMETIPMPDGDYHVASLGEEKVAGIMSTPKEAKSTPPNWGTYITVEDVDEFASNVTNLRGTLLIPPTDIPGVGRFLMFQDPQGAMLSAITYTQE